MSPPIEDWLVTRCHIVDQNDAGYPDFTPSDTNLVAVGRQTRFEIGNLDPLLTYSTKLVIIDSRGNFSTTSAFVQQATEAVGPFHANNEAEFGTINPNPSFGIFTKNPNATPPGSTTTPPDHWQPTTGTWGSGAGQWYYDSSTLQGGNVALKWVTTSVTGTSQVYVFESDPILVPTDRIYIVQFAWRHDGNPGTKTGWLPGVRLLDNNKSSLGTAALNNTLLNYSSVWATIAPANTWVFDRGWFVPSANTRYVQIKIDVNLPGSDPQGGHPMLFFDHFTMARSFAKVEVLGGTANRTAAPSPVWTKPWFNSSAAIDNALGWTAGVPGAVEHQYVIPFDGEYILVGIAELTAMTSGAGFFGRFLRNAGTLVEGQASTHAASAMSLPRPTVSSGIINLLKGDVIQYEITHNDTVARTIAANGERFRVVQIA